MGKWHQTKQLASGPCSTAKLAPQGRSAAADARAFGSGGGGGSGDDRCASGSGHDSRQ